MTDNVTANQGAGGPTFATDESGGIHYPLTKVVWGSLDTFNIVDDVAGKRLPITGSVTLAAPPPGGDVVRDVQKIIEEYDGTNITSSTTVRNGPCTLAGIMIVSALAGATVAVFDNTAASGTKVFSATFAADITQSIPILFHRKMTTGVQVSISGAAATVDVLTR